MIDFKIANEAYKLMLTYGGEEPKAPTSLIAARGDTAAFQVIVNSDNRYSVTVSKTEWFSDATILRKSFERLRLDVDAPFDVALNIEEFVTDDDGIKKADILLNSDSRDSNPSVPSAVYAELKVPEDAKAGDYTVKIRLYSSLYTEDEKMVSELSLPLTVYDVRMPSYRERKFHLDLWQHN